MVLIKGVITKINRIRQAKKLAKKQNILPDRNLGIEPEILFQDDFSFKDKRMGVIPVVNICSGPFYTREVLLHFLTPADFFLDTIAGKQKRETDCFCF